MKKGDAQGLFYLFILAMIVAFFSWLYNTIGPIGIFFLAILIVGGLIYMSKQKKERYLKEYYDDVLYFLHTRLKPAETKPFSKKYMKSDFNKWSLLRCLQTMRDSIDIALSSKKQDTAESRMELAGKQFKEVLSKHKNLITPEILQEIEKVYKDAVTRFKTSLYINVANGHIEKSQNLKTDKSKIKYLNLALEIIVEGIELGRGSVDKLQQKKEEILKQKSVFES